ncbi:hypothetical protein GFS60_01293 [Rhodococcus sp. WAY2]|nr:hypothetical protein GFS60_01293 [Rhodococcus sp. WAY2]
MVGSPDDCACRAVGIFGRNADTLSKAVEELGGSGEGRVFSAIADVADE